MKTFLSASVYPWAVEDSFFFRGYLIAEERLLRGKDAILYLRELFFTQGYDQTLKDLNGVYSIIWDRGEEILLAVDRLRGLPIFYALVNGELFAGDAATSIVEALPQKNLDKVAAEELISTEIFVSGSHTLIQELSQVQAGSFCLYETVSCTVQSISYFQMEHGDFFDMQDLESVRREFYQAYERTSNNLVRALDGRTAVVPLSGGADSRMVVTMLKRAGYEKVICFTYGKPGNREAEISRKVANHLGYPWHMIPYTGKMWKELRNSPLLQEYEHMAFGYTSTPHIQDILAVKVLKEQALLPEDSVFVPGHSGDLLAGSHITEEFLASKMSMEVFLQAFRHKFYVHPTSASLDRHIASEHPFRDDKSMESWASQIEWFNIQERQAKFIVNSVRAYEFFGYEWLIPLWDVEQFAFWQRVPISWRYQRKLYFWAVDDKLPSTNDETVATRLAERVRKRSILRQLLRRGKRILEYWDSPLRCEQLFPATVYFKQAVICDPEFAIQTLNSRRMVEKVKKQLSEK